MNGKTMKRIAEAMLGVLLVISLGFFIHAWRQGHFQSVASLRAYLQTYGCIGPLALILIQALQVVLPVLPGFLGCAVGAMMFGAAHGFWINYIGISAGSLAAYWLARWFGENLVHDMIPMDEYNKWITWINGKRSFSIMLFLAILLPLAPDDYLCYLSGLASMPAKRFTLIILLAKPWCILFYCLFFAYLI